MKKCTHTLRGSTLAETLVMMIVAGIIFLSVMDGLRLFNRLLVQRMRTIEASGRITAGYYRLEALVAGTDSLYLRNGVLQLYCGAEGPTLEVADSALVCRRGALCDTLLRSVDGLYPVPGNGMIADTVVVGYCASAGGFALRFASKKPMERHYEISIGQIEEGYGYEE